MKNRLLILAGLLCFHVQAQVSQEAERLKEIAEAENYLSDASEQLESDFPLAEAEYRKAISLYPEDETGKYNLGNAYYDKELNDQAMNRFKQAAAVAETKPAKHKAFHNLGNTFMNAKRYQEAVEAYKNALRNNPTDEETRYNLALAKEMLEKNPPEGGGGDDDQENEQEQEQEQEQQQDNQDQGDQGEDGDQEQENQDQGEDENQDQGDQQGDQGDPNEQQNKKPQDGDQQQQRQPQPGQLSPQQIQNLLDAMNNEEKKVQDKINAKKQKGAKVKSDKDW
jgi:tetratricopeptide (TPR) repeat protein